MERRLNNKLSVYLTKFKNDLKEKIIDKQSTSDGNLSMSDCNDLMVFMYDYEGFCFTQDDFVKRKRVKNIVPVNDRCCARRANNEQCTRRKKDGFDYCGTHVKGTPNGFRTISTVDPSSRNGMSSSFTILATTPLLPCLPAILSPTFSFLFLAT